MRGIFSYLVLPPVPIYILMVLGLLVARWRPRAGYALTTVALGLLVVLSMPVVAHTLMQIAQRGVEPLKLSESAVTLAETDDKTKPVIIILAAGIFSQAPEVGGPRVDPMTLERLQFGAALHRKTGYPILVTGGLWGAAKINVAQLMADTLKEDFRVSTEWVEGRAVNTGDNARYSAEILLPTDHKDIILVTHAWHMVRSEAAFTRAGFQVAPAPMGFEGREPRTVWSFLPRAKALHESYLASRELIGQMWYWLRKSGQNSFVTRLLDWLDQDLDAPFVEP